MRSEYNSLMSQGFKLVEISTGLFLPNCSFKNENNWEREKSVIFSVPKSSSIRTSEFKIFSSHKLLKELVEAN